MESFLFIGLFLAIISLLLIYYLQNNYTSDIDNSGSGKSKLTEFIEKLLEDRDSDRNMY